MIVVDASIAVRILSREIGAEAALARIASADARLAPDWLRLEVASAMSRKVREGTISAAAASSTAAGVMTLIENQIDSFALLDMAFDLSIRIGHAMYDCLYLAAGLRHDASVVTGDIRFADRAALGGFGAQVELLA